MADKVKFSKKINLIFFISSYGIGGFERVLKNLVDNFDKTQFNITVIICYPWYKSKNISEQMRQKYFKFLYWNDVERFIIDLKSPFHVHAILKCVKILKKKRTKVLFFFALGMGTFIAPLAGIIAGVPIIIRTGANILDGLYPRFFKPVDSYLLKYIQKIIFPAYFLKYEYLRNFNIADDKISVIYNGIHLSLYSLKYKSSHIKNELGINNKNKIIGIIANLIPVKSHEVLIKAMPSVVKNYPNIKLIIIGEGPQECKLRKLVSQLKLESYVIFLGYRSNIAQLISIFDIGILCSKSEIHPVSLLEIMASGVPVIAPRVGGIPEIVKHDKNGLLFSVGRSDELSQCIVRLLGNKKEASLFGKRGKQFVRDHFSLRRMVVDYQNIIIHLNHVYE
ncbi:MAG: glycosyltransferase [bacterium]